MRFIQTVNDDGRDIVLNPAHILWIERAVSNSNSKRGRSRITFIGEVTLYVQEDVFEMDSLVSSVPFIEVNTKELGIRAFNTSQILSVDVADGKGATTLTLLDGQKIEVEDKYDDVLKLIGSTFGY